MKKGGKRLLVIPSSLAYGKSGLPPKIAADTSLIMEVDLVRVKLASGKDDDANAAGMLQIATPPVLRRPTRLLGDCCCVFERLWLTQCCDASV
jgi:hypothetical protein